jgi:hypothetical protein
MKLAGIFTWTLFHKLILSLVTTVFLLKNSEGFLTQLGL